MYLVIIPILKYKFKAKSIHKIDDGDIKQLYHLVFSQLSTIDDSKIKHLIKQLKKDRSKIKITDLGAGSKLFFNGKIRSIKSIVKSASTYGKYGKLLAQLIKSYKVNKVIELGTSLGIGSCYMAMFNPDTTIYSIEGCQQIKNKAEDNLSNLGINNVHLFLGEFNQTLDKVIALSSVPSMVYIDGDHTYKSTIKYFNYFINKTANNTILVFDDIYWSRGMYKAWLKIIAHPSSKLTVDLFRMGIVFIDSNLDKKHFIVKF